MNRFFVLVKFEIKKVLSQKKAILFLLALNVVPILASALALLVYMKFKGWGIGNLEFSMLLQAVRALFIAHIKFFSFISPFFLALIVAESFSAEFGRGYLKTLLLTPVARWQVVIAKTISILIFLLIAISLGGFFLQLNLWIAGALGESPAIIMDLDQKNSSTLVEPLVALNLLFISFAINLTLIGFFSLVSLFFDSPILMTFSSLIILISVQAYTMMAPFLEKVDMRYGEIAKWCFTKPLSRLSDIDTVSGLLEKKVGISSKEILDPLVETAGWGCLFFLLTLIFFQRRQVLK